MLDNDENFEQLEQLLGIDALNRLVDGYAGSNLYIPKRWSDALRYRAIRKEYQDGKTYKELSIRYGYTETHIRNIIHKKESKDESK